MDFSGLNKAASSDYPETVKLGSLKSGETLTILSIRKVKTQQWGWKIVVEIESKRCFFLPSRVSEYFLDEELRFQGLKKLADANNLKCIPLGGYTLTFHAEGKSEYYYSLK